MFGHFLNPGPVAEQPLLVACVALDNFVLAELLFLQLGVEFIELLGEIECTSCNLVSSSRSSCLSA